LRFPVGRIYEDAATTHKILEKCEKIIIIPECVYYWRQNINSITHTKNLKYYTDMIWVFKEQYKYFLDINKNLSEFIYKKFYNYLINTYFETVVEKKEQLRLIILEELKCFLNDKEFDCFAEGEIALVEDILNNINRKELLIKASKNIKIRQFKTLIKNTIGIFKRNKDFYI